MIGESWSQTRIATSFRYNIFAYLHSELKNYRLYTNIVDIRWLLYYRRWPFSVLELDVRYNWRVMALNTHRSFFPIIHLCILTHITWKLQVIYGHSAYGMTAVLSETFLVWFTVAREILQTCISHSLLQNCVCILQTHKYITVWCATTPDSKTHLPYDCMLHTKRWLYCQRYIIL